MKFNEIRIEGWQQFDTVEVNFHPRLTILTGANGSGKSTILRLLGQHFGWNYQHLTTPRRDPKSGIIRFLLSIFRRRGEDDASDSVSIGSIAYSNEARATIRAKKAHEQAPYTPSIEDVQPICGLFMPADRPEFVYTQVTEIPTRPRLAADAFNQVHSRFRERTLGGGGRHPTYDLKQVIIGLALFSRGSDVVEQDDEARRLIDGFQDVLRTVMPREIGYRGMTVRANAEIVMLTESGEFLLDAMSGGVGALFSMAWQIFMFAADNADEFTVLIDEPETHLHASMQRSLLPNLLEAFPRCQFIVATHSPLIVGSVKESNVYVIAFDEDRRVRSRFLDVANRAASANQILRDVLGLDSTMPIWADQQLRAIIDKYARVRLGKETLGELRSELDQLGLAAWLPEAVSSVVDKKDEV
jgi:predicted ATP-binding protein involved in virulence